MEANFTLPFFSLKKDDLENILQKTPFGFSLINAEHTLEFANEAWLNIFEKKAEDVAEKSLYDIFPESTEFLASGLESAKLTGQPFTPPEQVIRQLRSNVSKDTYFSSVYHPVYDTEKNFLYFVMVVLEITGLAGIKNKIEESEERLRLATESSQTATWDLNLKTSEIIHSAYLSKIFGYGEDEDISHQQLRSHISEFNRQNVLEKAFEKALKTGIYQYEVPITDKSGIEKWVATHGKMFFDDEGQPIRMLGVMQDITERKKSEILLKQSHHQLNTAMEATKLGTFEMDPETLQKYNFSPRFLEIFGYDAEKESIGADILEKHIHRNFIKTRTEALCKAKKTGDLYYQTQIVLRDGSVKWIELYGRLLPPANGSKAYISGTVRDITELKNFEEKISASEKKYRFLADSMPQIVWIGEPDGRITYFNKSALDYSGKDYNDFVEGNGWLEIVHPDEQKENLRLWEKSVKTKKPFFYEHRFRNKQNEYRWFMSRAYPELDELGNVTKWVGTSTDIDEMKKQEKQKNDFIKMANHELKTPVTTIKGYVQLLKKMRGDSEDQFLVNSLNTIENQVNKLTLLIGDLLDISRIESGKLPLNKAAFSLLKLVTETIEDIKASEHSHQINFQLKHTADIEVYGDKDRITQVLNNLLTNAIKYSPNAGSVNVELFVEHNSAVVSVEDFGIGMDQKELKKIFERFYRVSGDDEETFPGFGIGLFIVKDIMNRHNGKIWVESEKNSGSKFYFSLPIFKNL